MLTRTYFKPVKKIWDTIEVINVMDNSCMYGITWKTFLISKVSPFLTINYVICFECSVHALLSSFNNNLFMSCKRYWSLHLCIHITFTCIKRQDIPKTSFKNANTWKAIMGFGKSNITRIRTFKSTKKYSLFVVDNFQSCSWKGGNNQFLISIVFIEKHMYRVFELCVWNV